MGSPITIPGINFDPANPTHRLVSRADGGEAASDDQINREVLVQKIRESCVQAVEWATLPAEMAKLAAQQVNEVRLRALESPKEIATWKIAAEFGLNFFINSSFGEKAMAKLLQCVFGRVLSHERVFRALPKSVFGFNLLKDISQLQRDSRRFVTQAAKQSLANQERLKSLKEAEQILAAELTKYAQLKKADEYDIKLYAGWIDGLLSQPKNVSSLVKATVSAAKTKLSSGGKDQNLDSSDDEQKTEKTDSKKNKKTKSDSASVSILEYYTSVARMQRLQIETNHIAYEYIARTFPLTDNTIALLLEHMNFSRVFDGQPQDINWENASLDLRLRIEAMIWAIHLGFSVKRRTPDVDPKDPSLEDVFRPSINATIVKYLFTRFGKIVEAWLIEKGNRFPLGWDQANNSAKAVGLQLYLGSIGDEFS